MALPFPISPGLLHADFTMSHATEADAECIASIYYAAFQTDPGNTYWWPADTAAMTEWMLSRIRRKMADRSVRHFKVVDARTGGMVAFARWDVPRGSGAFGEWVGGGEVNGAGPEADVSGLVKEGESEGRANGEAPAPLTGGDDAPQPSSSDVLDMPRGADRELCRGFFDGLSRMSSKWMAEDMLGKHLARDLLLTRGCCTRAVTMLTAARPLTDCDVDKVFQEGRRKGSDSPYAENCRRRRPQDLSRSHARWQARL